MRTITVALVLAALLAGGWGGTATSCRADDFDDGIEADESSLQYGDLGSSNKNFSYLAQRARSKARSGSGDVVLSDGGSLNSVILDAGAQINGDIIIIDDSKGDKTVIAK
ncbi:hypothetical protein [Desulfobulbus elongatus]|uniref:hypothetical protein n=1 Tax=Desulfobulbus elongatus TaxID=53332 RepID=UPI0004852906|nr:hypothetical protein [Desulfobulbus elongatus]